MEFGTGNTGFMLIATALVLLMTPGLALFYGGLVGSKNVVAVMMHSFVSLGVSTILWYVVGFSLAFSGGEGGVIGNLDWAFLNGVSLTDAWTGAGSIPVVLFFVYQMMFAVITPALITGAFTNRIRFGPYLAFLALWQLFVYYPFAHMVWGGGLLADWGVLDFAGESSSTHPPVWQRSEPFFTWGAVGRPSGAPTTFPLSLWAQLSCGSDGSVLTPGASWRSTTSRSSRSSTPTWLLRLPR